MQAPLPPFHLRLATIARLLLRRSPPNSIAHKVGEKGLRIFILVCLCGSLPDFTGQSSREKMK
jgi:hypothetical protein